jgi:hypothetical protein
MLHFEKDMFEDLMKVVDNSDRKLDLSLSGGEERKKNELLMFSEDVEELVDLEGNKLGPFSKGEMVNIPKEIAKILIEDGKAESVE